MIHGTKPRTRFTYFGNEADWKTIRKFFGTFSHGIRVLAELIRTDPEALRRLTDQREETDAEPRT